MRFLRALKRARSDMRPLGLLARLRRDAAGNVLALTAAAIIPMLAITGSAIDAARLYTVKVRLQQACDAGVLAGRKFMSSTGSTLDTNAATQATTFFNNNFKSGWFQTNTVSFTPSKTSDNQVNGVASTKVPLAVMGFFGAKAVTLNVTCKARYDVADTDVMFVLDVTGSMSCKPTDSTSCANTAVSYTLPDGTTDYYNQEKSGSKLQAVRDAVVDFYTTLKDSSDSTTHIRYGFVPYASTVNAGKAIYTLSPSYFVASAKYQTRKQGAVDVDTSVTYKSTSNSTNCNAYAYTRTPATGYSSSTGNAKKATVSYNSGTCTVTTTTYTPTWLYAKDVQSVTSYLATINGGTITDPTRVTGDTTSWQGCIEEADTTPGLDDVSDYDIDNLPADLDPDVNPNDDTKRWKPMWPDVVYGRYYFTSTSSDTETGDTNTLPDNSSNYPQNANYAGYSARNSGMSPCPKAASVLATMTQSDVQAYVDALRPHGGTYHDIGMIWGTRMISPNGIFKQYTQAWAGRSDPQRVIVFLTDGAMAPTTTAYSAYGIEYFDKRVRGNNTDALDDYHNARFLTECAKAKSENIDVWVVAVGQSLTTPLTQCASKTSQALYAGTGADLSAAFQTIAKQVAKLRISQ